MLIISEHRNPQFLCERYFTIPNLSRTQAGGGETNSCKHSLIPWNPNQAFQKTTEYSIHNLRRALQGKLFYFLACVYTRNFQLRRINLTRYRRNSRKSVYDTHWLCLWILLLRHKYILLMIFLILNWTNMHTLWFSCKAAYPQEILCIDTSFLGFFFFFFCSTRT